MQIRTNARLNTQPDSVILALAIEGNKPAFTELVLRHSARIRNLLRKLCRQHSLADDLAQITFLQIWKNIGRLKSAAVFVTWSNRIAVNAWLEEQRRVSPDTTSDPAIMTNLVDRQPGPERHLRGLEIERALNQLNSTERLCVVLAFSEGYTHEQIAELAHIPLGTAKSHVLRGSEKLKRIIGANEPGGDEHD